MRPHRVIPICRELVEEGSADAPRPEDQDADGLEFVRRTEEGAVDGAERDALLPCVHDP